MQTLAVWLIMTALAMTCQAAEYCACRDTSSIQSSDAPSEAELESIARARFQVQINQIRNLNYSGAGDYATTNSISTVRWCWPPHSILPDPAWPWKIRWESAYLERPRILHDGVALVKPDSIHLGCMPALPNVAANIADFDRAGQERAE